MGASIHKRINAHCRWLSRPTRMRLAVCLATSWHFARGTGSSCFPRDYCYGSASNKKSGDWSFELSRVGYLFLTEDERTQLGPWPIRLVVPLQEHLLALQVELLTQTPVFSLLTENPQVEAEHRIHLLYKEKLIASKIGMRARARSSLLCYARCGSSRSRRICISWKRRPFPPPLAHWLMPVGCSRCRRTAKPQPPLGVSRRRAMSGDSLSDDHGQRALLNELRSPGCCAKDLRSSATRFATVGAAEKARMLAVKTSVDQAIPMAFAMGA